jgi:hypothetical protein
MNILNRIREWFKPKTVTNDDTDDWYHTYMKECENRGEPEYNEYFNKIIYHGDCLTCSIQIDNQPTACIGCVSYDMYHDRMPWCTFNKFDGYDEKGNMKLTHRDDVDFMIVGTNFIRRQR